MLLWDRVKDAPLAEVVGQRDVLEEAVDDGGGLEGRGGLLNGSNHSCLSGNVREDE